MSTCHKCGTSLKAETDYGRQDTCITCSFATRVCLNCKHYDPSRYNECTESVADRVVDKEKSNFCDYFKPSERTVTAASESPQEKARKAAEALFKKS